MQIIPVIDLKNGIVVHAKQGDRDNYAPLHSPLCPAANAFDLVRIFQQDFNFRLIYIADLNALTNKGNNHSLIADLLGAYPAIQFWIDSGLVLPDFADHHYDNYVPVIGSESLTEDKRPDLLNLNQDFILSLDFSASGPLGAKSLFLDKAYWPSRIIVMTLAKVGSNQGPDLALLRSYQDNFPGITFIAAGGIRHQQDLFALSESGVEQCLLASALHSGSLTLQEIAELQTKKYPGERGIF